MKYAIHPGEVRSKNDGDIHFIGYKELIRLYKLNLKDCILWDIHVNSTFLGRDPRDYIHCYPKEDGDYNINPSE